MARLSSSATAPVFDPPRYTAGYRNLTLAANPTDFFAFLMSNYYRVGRLRKLVVEGVAGATAAVSSAGSGYAVGDTLTLANGALLRVATVSTGAVATVTMIAEPTSQPNGTVAVSSTTGSGTGATFTFTYNKFPLTVDVILQRSANGGGGTAVSMQVGRLDSRDMAPLAAPQVYTANRSSNGDGISSTRPVLAARKLTFATSNSVGVPAVFEFEDGKGPMIRDLSQEYIVANLAAQNMPNGATLNVVCEWEEPAANRICFVGDSTVSNATQQFADLGFSGYLNSLANIDNLGSNGFRLTDYLMNTNGVTYPQSNVLGRTPAVLVLCYGLNDVRQGATTTNQLISMIDAAIYATLNGTTSGATYTSTMGAGTTFTWPSTIAANPDCKIILWGQNSLLTDTNGGSYVVLSGLWSAMTLAQAAQAITDQLYTAYEAFRGDPRIFALVQKQDVTGRTAATLAANAAAGKPWWTDILHPNARGQKVILRPLVPYLERAVKAADRYNF